MLSAVVVGMHKCTLLFKKKKKISFNSCLWFWSNDFNIVLLRNIILTVSAFPMDGIATNNKCQCLTTTSAIIPPRLFHKIEILPPGAHCRKIEILWVMMFCLYTLQSQTWGNVHGGGHFLSLTNLRAFENTLHYLHIYPRSSQTNVTYSPDKYCCI